MRYVEKHPMIMIVIGVIGISLSSIFVKYSTAPSAVTAAFRLLWTVLFLTPVVLGKKAVRKELLELPGKLIVLSCLSGLFLAIHFVLWFESLRHTSVASSTTIVCTEVIWVCLGFCLFLKGRLSVRAIAAIAVTLAGSGLIALSDSGSGSQFYGDVLALLAAIAVAVYTLIGRVVRIHASTTVYTYMVYTACAAVLAATCAVQGHRLFAYGLSPIIVGALLAIFSTILGHSIFSWCLKYFSPSFVSASKLCEPVAAAMMAAFLFGEIPVPLQILGGILILGGVCWYSRIERKEQ
ncbi:MAG: DMT family transporter [Oscillospiraceae bacterium]|nr:DMT family transporter [Oscillospiraceae bacterium]